MGVVVSAPGLPRRTSRTARMTTTSAHFTQHTQQSLTPHGHTMAPPNPTHMHAIGPPMRPSSAARPTSGRMMRARPCAIMSSADGSVPVSLEMQGE